jgi:iron complex outermembrane receptor protein
MPQGKPATMLRVKAARRAKAGLMSGISLAALVATAPVAIPSAFAQSANNAGIEDIIVTARRREETLQSQALSISAIGAEKLEAMNVKSLLDLTGVPNVSFNKQPGFMNTVEASIRGITESDPILTNDQPIAMYVDGVLIGRAVAAGLDLIEPERVEILRGPQGSLFGRNTTGGAINITLPQPTDDMGVTLRVGYASNNELTLRGIIDTGVLGSSGLKARIAVQRHTMDGYVRNTKTSDGKFWPGADETNNLYFALHGDIGSSGASFDYRLDYSHMLQYLLSSQLTYADPDIVAYYANSPALGGDALTVSPNRLGAMPLLPLQRSKGHVFGNALTVNVPFNDAINLKSITALRYFTTDAMPNSSGQGLLFGPVVTNFAPFTVEIQRVTPYELARGLFGNPEGDHSHQRQISQELQLQGQIGRHKYVAGGYFFTEKFKEKYYAFLTLPGALVGLPPTLGFNAPGGANYNGKSESYAVYLSDTYTPPILDDKLEITGGIRYTIDKKTLDFPTDIVFGQTFTHHYRKFSAVSGDFTAKYQWTPDFMTYFRFANAYKSGGFGGRDAPNAPGFEPETANNFEVGLKSDWLDRRLRVNADIFFTKYDDKQISTFSSDLSAGGVNASHVANAGSAQYLGSEVEVTLQPVQQWQVELNWGHTWPKYNQFLYQPLTNGPIFNIAGSARFNYFSKTSFSIGTQYTVADLSIGELSLRADYSFKSGVYFHPSNTFNTRNELIKSGNQTLLNASINLAHIPISQGKSELAVSVYSTNLLNKHFRIQGVDYGVLGIAGDVFNRPRVVGFNVTAKY